MQVNFREIWYNYRSEVVFFIVLSAIVALSTYLSQFIPEAVFDNTITPILITATVATAFIGVWLMRHHHNGIKARKLFGWALVVWGLSDLVYLIGWAAAPHQVMDMGATELTNYELLLGNLLGWVLLFYPTEALRPGWMTSTCGGLSATVVCSSWWASTMCISAIRPIPLAASRNSGSWCL